MIMLEERLRRQDGAAAVELALVLPVLFLLVFGMIDFARAYNAHVSATGAAREGVRVLAIEKDLNAAQQAAKDAAPTLDKDGDGIVDITFSPAPVQCSPSDKAKLYVAYQFDYITPVGAFMAWFGGGSGTMPATTLTGIGVMRCGG